MVEKRLSCLVARVQRVLGADFAPRESYIKVNGVKSGTPPSTARPIDSEQTADGEVRPTEGTVAHLEW